MNYLWAGASHLGRLRPNNEDAVHPAEPGSGPGPAVIAVADGLGGHVGGEIASRLAIDSAVATQGTPAERITAANTTVVEAIVENPDLAGMGTTLTLGIFAESGQLELAHVGDSRAYLYRGGEFQQLTTDHTYVAQLVAQGRLTPTEAEHHPQRNLLTRVVGMAKTLAVDTLTKELMPGDRILLCSDGLTGMLTDSEIAAFLSEGEPPEETVWTLIEAANNAGGEDNVTVALVDVAA